MYYETTQNNFQCSKNRTDNAVNAIIKQENKPFRLYLGNRTFNRLKIIFNVLKMKLQKSSSKFQIRQINVFASNLLSVPPSEAK